MTLRFGELDVLTPLRSGGSGRHSRAVMALAGAMCLLAIACAAPAPYGAGASGAGQSVAPMPRLGHVWIIVFENKSAARIVGAAAAPTINQLISRGGLADRYEAVTHPSQPNYIAMFSGSTHGVTNDRSYDVVATSIADQLDEAGLSWREYAENVPPDCFTGALAKGGRDGPGEYDRAKSPAISFTSIADDPARCADIQDFTAFDPGAADVEFILPNMCHSMHDCSIAEGDAWLAGFLPRILDSAAFADRGALIVTFDEGDLSDRGGGRVATVVVSPLVQAGTVSDVHHDHYSLLRTVEDGFGLPCLALSCTAAPMSELFTRPSGGPGAS